MSCAQLSTPWHLALAQLPETWIFGVLLTSVEHHLIQGWLGLASKCPLSLVCHQTWHCFVFIS